MRKTFDDHRIEPGRARTGHYASEPGDRYGAFVIRGPKLDVLTILASDGDEQTPWEHVSVSLPNRAPDWDEMCFVKSLFWDDDECVVQYHPPRSAYVNIHQHTLHLWKRINEPFPMPPIGAV